MEVTSSILSLSFQQKERPLQCQPSSEADKEGQREQCLYQDGHHVCSPAAFGAGSWPQVLGKNAWLWILFH